MKVIGTTRLGYLVEMAPDEVRRLTNDGQPAPAVFGDRGVQLRTDLIGKEYDVSKTLSDCDRVFSSDAELKRAADAIRGLANAIEAAAPNIAEPLPEEPSAANPA